MLAFLLPCAVLLAASPTQVAEPDTTSVEATYVIGSGDVLQLFVWKEPELTRDLTVRLDGRITVPLIGDLEASGKTPAVLGQEIAAKLARFVETPQVTMGVAQANSSRFYVMGQVTKPGDYPMAGPMTVVQALAVAGGLKEFAKSTDIQIIRRTGQGQAFVPVNYKKLEDGRDSSQNVFIRPGDTILVP